MIAGAFKMHVIILKSSRSSFLFKQTNKQNPCSGLYISYIQAALVDPEVIQFEGPL